MKIYSVVDNVDLGYHVLRSFFRREDAEKEAKRLHYERYEKLIENYTIYPDIMDGTTKTYDEAKEYVDTFFNWHQYTIEELEVEE